ncbi:MAG: ABC transporter ATP-binding protein [Candidatus Latescibacteria bacterium]|jgi:ABC-2 type transport system ATP-binding protein|nr:ABC transporter ATP-binding protein [Candidatus Latescibacterota bacterium]MBT4139291.1 ABC transporter ATP-binding protein [Candidatus Latescibacterota bacterium]
MMVHIQDMWKRYPGTWALRGISLDVEKGRVLGVLGENGSGKSTMLRILAGVTHPTKGTVLLNGQEVGVETKKWVAYLPEVNPFYDWMRVMEQVEFLSVFYPEWDMNKARQMIDFMGLDGDKKVGALSRGQKGRLKVACAFSWPSELVLMDEPLAGIDPPSRKKILEALFHEYRFGEQTIMMSTHMVHEVGEFIEDVIFVKEGEIALSGNADALREERDQSLSEMFEVVAM